VAEVYVLWCWMEIQADECSGVVAHALATFPRRMHKAPDLGSSESNPAPPRPDPLRVWEGSLLPSGIMATADFSLRSEGIQDRAYLSIGVTSSSGVELCGVPGEGDSKGIGAGICKILQVNFREFIFHALR
jgi:hypothetical protein